MLPFRPRLRADLTVEIGPDSAVFTDMLLRRRLDLGTIGDVLAALDGRSADDIVSENPRAEGVLRTLLLLSMFEEAGAPLRAGLARHLSGVEPLPVQTLPGARFACQGSGGCCRNYIFGPLTDADVARVSALDLSAFGLNDGPFWEERPRPDGRVDRYLRTTPEGACRFLEAGSRCGLHARHGGSSKPGFCQLFPLVPWPTIRGLRLGDSGECLSFPASAEVGDPLTTSWEAVRSLLPDVPPAHPLVHLAPGAPCDLGFWLPVQDRLVAAVRTAPPADTLRALGVLISSSISALRRCELRADGPDDALATLPSADLAYALPMPTRTTEGRVAIARLATSLAALYGEPLTRGYPAPPFTRELVEALTRVTRAAEGGPPLPGEDPLTRPLWATAFRQRLFGPRALVDGRPRAGLLRMAMDWLVARAAPGGERQGHVLVSRRLDMPWAPAHRLFVAAQADLEDVLDALPAF